MVLGTLKATVSIDNARAEGMEVGSEPGRCKKEAARVGTHLFMMRVEMASKHMLCGALDSGLLEEPKMYYIIPAVHIISFFSRPPCFLFSLQACDDCSNTQI